jgi:hypothetical protein
MKKLITVVLVGVIMAVCLNLVGCSDETGCKGDGNCYYVRDVDQNKWCGDTGCNVYSTPDVGQSRVDCDC